MKARTQKALALILAVVMLLGVSVPVFADEEEPLSYVALGDSCSIGYGLQGFDYSKSGKNSHVDAAYIWHVGDYLGEKLGKKVETTNLALCGMRPNELVYFLDETVGYDDIDAFGRLRYGGYTTGSYKSREELTSTYKNAIANADYITYDLGINNFSNYMLSRVTGIFGIDLGFPRDGFYDEHFNELMEENGFEISVNIKNELTALVEKYTKGAVTEDLIEEIVDAVLFSYASFCIGFRDSIDKIYELNPDVCMIVVGLFNDLEGNVIAYQGTELDIGALWGGFIGLCNSYIIDFNEHNGDYMYADLSGGVETVIMAIGKGNTYPDLNEDLLDLFYSDTLLGSLAPLVMGKIAYGTEGEQISKSAALNALNSAEESPEKTAVLHVIDVFMQSAAFYAPINADEGMAYFKDGLNAFKPLFDATFTDFENASNIGKSAVRLFLNFLENGTGVHPSEYGYQQKLAAVEKAYDLQVAADGHRLIAAAEKGLSFLERLFKSPDWLQTIRDMIREFFESLPVPIKLF